MGKWNGQDFEHGTDAITILGQNTEREPCNWIRLIHRPRPPVAQAANNSNNSGVAYPMMMIEIGFSQSLPDPHQTVAIKIFGLRTNTSINSCIVPLYKSNPADSN